MTKISVAAAQSRLVRGRKELLKRLDAHERRGKLNPSSKFDDPSFDDPSSEEHDAEERSEA